MGLRTRVWVEDAETNQQVQYMQAQQGVEVWSLLKLTYGLNSNQSINRDTSFPKTSGGISGTEQLQMKTWQYRYRCV